MKTKLLFWMLPLLFVLGACDQLKQLSGMGPKAGEKCESEGKQVCQDDKNALACHGGKWEVMPCRGLTGCMGVDNASCANEYAIDGDVCNLEGDTVCADNKKERLVCENNRWKTVEKCPGQNGCQVNVKRVLCNQ